MQIDVPTMMQMVHHDYAEDNGLQLVQLRYRKSHISMLILLPGQGQLDRLERDLDTQRLTRLARAVAPRYVCLFLPRFRVESRFELRSALQNLGMRTTFGPDADFTRASNEPGFQLGEILHKTFVNVDESGTEAAAATAVTLIGAVFERVVVRVDRPFLFLIRDANTGTVLFMGRVVDPRVS
jgi:serpin B